MAKLNVGKQFELSKSLTTEAGGELEEPLQYLSELGEQVLRALRNQLTFADNFSCEIKATKLRHNVAIPIELGNRRPSMVLPLLVRSTRYALTQPLRYYFDANGKFNVIGMFCDLLPMQRYPELDCSGGPTIVVDQSQTPFNIGDLVFVDSVSGGAYVDQLATVTNRTSSSFTLTLVGTGSARRVAVSGHLVKPVSRATDIPVDLLILF